MGCLAEARQVSPTHIDLVFSDLDDEKKSDTRARFGQWRTLEDGRIGLALVKIAKTRPF
jgi:hypothetical protein